MLTKSASAEVQITLRSPAYSGPATIVQPIPLEPFSVNKEMGRILIRRGGETIAAGKFLSLHRLEQNWKTFIVGVVLEILST